jgi:hypothetical protein
VALKFIVEDREDIPGTNEIVDVFRTTLSTPAASATRALAITDAQALTLSGDRDTDKST